MGRDLFIEQSQTFTDSVFPTEPEWSLWNEAGHIFGYFHLAQAFSCQWCSVCIPTFYCIHYWKCLVQYTLIMHKIVIDTLRKVYSGWGYTLVAPIGHTAAFKAHSGCVGKTEVLSHHDTFPMIITPLFLPPGSLHMTQPQPTNLMHRHCHVYILKGDRPLCGRTGVLQGCQYK